MRYRNVLLATAACGAAFGVQSAEATEPVKLSVGGFFKEAYMVVVDDDGEGELGNQTNTDGFFNDAEIHFTGATVLDNGLEVGARVELEGETDGDQIDEAWVWFSGGWGELRIGSEDEALANACVVPPGGTGNFSAFSPNQWGANTGGLFALGVAGSNSICAGVDDVSDAQKLVYITPSFGGFQITLSYTPDGAGETHADGVGPHLGMPAHVLFQSRHNVSVYATYDYAGEDWGLTAGLGGSWQGHSEAVEDFVHAGERTFYQAGLNLTFGRFAVGVAGEYFDDVRDFAIGDAAVEVDSWVAGIGAAYQIDAWTFGLQYSHREDEDRFITVSFDAQQDRVVATAAYALGPGITVDGELGYTWIDTDPEISEFSTTASSDRDDYQAFEIGIGTSIAF